MAEFIFGNHPDKADADFVVCRDAVPVEELPDYFKDNVQGPCDGGCGTTLMWRPDAPEKPKICFRCMAGKIGDALLARTLEAYEEDEAEDASQAKFMDELTAKVGLVRTPEALAEVIDRGGIPKPGDESYPGFREGSAFALSLMFNVFGGEQSKGALADLCERHRDALAVMLWSIDKATDEALGLSGDAKPQPDADAVPKALV